MRKITLQLTVELTIEAEEGIEVNEIVDQIEFLSCAERTDCISHNIISHEVKDSR